MLQSVQVMCVITVLMSNANNVIFLNLIYAINAYLIRIYLISNVFQNVLIDSIQYKILWFKMKMDIYVNHVIIIAQLVKQLLLIGIFFKKSFYNNYEKI